MKGVAILGARMLLPCAPPGWASGSPRAGRGHSQFMQRLSWKLQLVPTEPNPESSRGRGLLRVTITSLLAL